MAGRVRVMLALVIGVAVMTGCSDPQPVPTTGGVTVPQSDGTPPEVTFGLAVQGGPTVTVSNGGNDQTLTLRSKTGTFNLLATAKDQESGLEDVQIWMTTTTTKCDVNGLCQTTGPGLAGAPVFSSPDPGKQPGDVVAPTSLLAETLDIATLVPQAGAPPGGSLTVKLEFWVVGINHLGGSSTTATAAAIWHEGVS